MRTAIVVLIAAFLTVPAHAGSKGGLLKAIERIESEEGALSVQLYQPLQELGLTLLESGEHELAIDTFRRMQHIVHQAYGVHAPEQFKSVELLIDTYTRMGQFQDVDTQEHFMYDIAERAFEPGDPGMVRAQARLARWYRNTSRFRDALELYETALEAVPQDDAELRVVLLRAEALTLYLAGKCCASKRLSEVATIISESDQFDFQEKRQAAIDYADMLMVERADGARDAYSSALALTGKALDAAMLGLRRPHSMANAIMDATMTFAPARQIIEMPRDSHSLFAKVNPLPVAIGNPVPVCSTTVENMLRTVNISNLDEYFIDVDVEIDDRGRARRIETAGNAPVGLNRYVRSVLEETRYRPGADIDGIASTSRISFRQTFSADNGVALTNDMNGWNALLTQQTCGLIEQQGISVMNAALSAD